MRYRHKGDIQMSLTKRAFIFMLFISLWISLPVTADDTGQIPIIFVHGYNSDISSWEETEFYEIMEERLTKGKVYGVDYGKNSRNDITSDEIQAVFKETFKQAIKDHAQIDVVAHSMGG